MGNRTGPERRILISVGMYKNEDRNYFFSAEPSGTGTHFLWKRLEGERNLFIQWNPGERERKLFSVESQGTGTQVIFLRGGARHGNKLYRLIEEGKGRERKVEICSMDERSRDPKWITICEPKGTGTQNGSEFGNRREWEPETKKSSGPGTNFTVPFLAHLG